MSESLTFGLHLSKIPTPLLASENERTISFEEDVILGPPKSGRHFVRIWNYHSTSQFLQELYAALKTLHTEY